MYGKTFSPESWQYAMEMVRSDFLFALWETLYATLLSTFAAFLIGLPLPRITIAYFA